MRVGFGICFVTQGVDDGPWLESSGVGRRFLATSPGDQPFVLDQAMNFLREGDIFVTPCLSRLGASLDAIVHSIGRVADCGAELHVGDDVPSGSEQANALVQASALLRRSMDQIGAFPGLGGNAPRASKVGRNRGRPAALTEAQRQRVIALVSEQQMSTRAVAKRFGVSPATIYRIVQGR